MLGSLTDIIGGALRGLLGGGAPGATQGATPPAFIISATANAYGLTPQVGAGLAAINIAHLDQTNESDAPPPSAVSATSMTPSPP